MYLLFFKRLFDFMAALFLFILFIPLFIIVTISLFFLNDQKPFFTQSRPGKNEKIFKILKFKTMNDKTDSQGNLLSDGERLTGVGKVIRKTSIDELPQLINVLKGDMSFIGPRPLLTRYLPFYTEQEKLRHSVRPGITGLAQVSGRNLLGWDKRLEKDIYYVQNLNFLLDISIFIRTIRKVIKSEDIAVDAQTIMLPLDEERSLKEQRHN
ncbi:sugar transferase [Aquimarina sp. ERC-38]|uniref:sugar transferase n=1 Tax=Aquimarina sp. ERC-38 TaxID=2949996 RepID=UPI002246E37B|nr:sugar transferase [Aquimarina sp. ERC-38]UZO80232.1 sugar transferase [Aquimarina sp. ERC-38]